MNHRSKLSYVLLASCALSTWASKPAASFWFTDTNFQPPGQAKVLPMIKSAPEKPNMSLQSPLGNIEQTPEASPSSPAAASSSPALDSSKVSKFCARQAAS